MYFQSKITAVFLLIICFTACKKTDSVDQESVGINLADYTVEDIPNSKRKMVCKYTEQGLLEEQGMVEGNQKAGTWTVFYAPNTKPKETWTYEAGKLNGLHFLYNNSGRIDMYESYRDNQLHGKRVTYKQGSPVEEMSYKNGKLDGIFRGFFPTGRLQRLGYFKNGIQDGEYIVYDEDKKIILQVRYNNGVQITK